MKLLWGVLPWLVLVPAWGQDDRPDGNPPASAEAQQGQQAQSADRTKDNSNGNSASQTPGKKQDRLFFALPNRFTVENANQAPRLKAADKFKITAKNSFDPVQFVWYGALAGIAQWEDDEPQYGQGAKGYWERYGVRLGDGVVENFMTQAVFASFLHQDPRYYQMAAGGIFHRGLYAASHVLITRSDSGKTEANFSEIFGAAAAGAVSTYTYHLQSERNLATVISVWTSQMGFDALGFIVKEFWPDLHHKLRKEKPGPGQANN